MNNLIERYIYDVVRRLPEQDREEVAGELRANIWDMLPENPGGQEVETALKALGSPSVLAEKYRQNPRYLVSPAIYENYIGAIKWVIPLVGCICLLVGCILALVEAVQGSLNTASLISAVISQGISMGISGAFQALVWTTVGFVIADRTGSSARADAWTPDRLPQLPKYSKHSISLSDSIVGLVLTVVFGAAALLLCLGVIQVPVLVTPQTGIVRVHEAFSQSFLAVCIPVIIIGCLLSICEAVVKLIYGRWNMAVCGTVVASNLIGAGMILFLFTRPVIFSADFSAYLGAQEWAQSGGFSFMGNSVGGTLALVVAAIIVAALLAESGMAVYRTVRDRKRK